MSKTVKGAIPENKPELGPCRLWIGTKTNNGYGKFTVGKITVIAHRFIYAYVNGEIPESITLDHLCRVRNCVEPHHCEPVTLGVNVLRGESVSAKNKIKTHCPSGHPYDKINTLITKEGARYCRECNRIRHRDWLNRKRNGL